MWLERNGSGFCQECALCSEEAGAVLAQLTQVCKGLIWLLC